MPYILNDDYLCLLREKYYSNSRFKIFKNKSIWLFNQLIEPAILRLCKPTAFIYIHSNYWIQLLGSEYYKQFLNIYISEGLIECDGSYKVGEKNKGYRLSKKCNSSGFLTIDADDSPVPKIDWLKKRADFLFDPELLVRKTTAWMQKLQIPSIEEFDQSELKPTKYFGVKLHLERFQDWNLYCKIDDC